jgi:hypothetical protein
LATLANCFHDGLGLSMNDWRDLLPADKWHVEGDPRLLMLRKAGDQAPPKR